MPDLKPCPFCGGEAYTVESINSQTFRVGCFTRNCIANANNLLHGEYSKEEAIEVWNRRAEEQKEGAD